MIAYEQVEEGLTGRDEKDGLWDAREGRDPANGKSIHYYRAYSKESISEEDAWIIRLGDERAYQ